MQLSTTDLYQDFILLDTSDAIAVHEFLKSSKAATTQNDANRGTSARKSFHSPGHTGGSARRLSAAKNQGANNCTPKLNCGFDDEKKRLRCEVYFSQIQHDFKIPNGEIDCN